MLLNFKTLKNKYDMNINGIIHVGAYYGEEISEYVNNGINNIHVFEPLKENLKILYKNLKRFKNSVVIYPYALGSREEKKKMIYLSSNNLQSSSFLKPSLHLKNHPHVKFNKKAFLEVKKLDSFKIINCNFINIDVQGFELEVLKGSKKTLSQINYIYCEINVGETYEGNPLVQDIDKYLKTYNFKRVETYFPYYKKFFFSKKKYFSWGDALYIKNFK